MGIEHVVGWEEVFVGCIVDEFAYPDCEDEAEEDGLNGLVSILFGKPP